MRYFITGGAGFIGSNMVEKLLQNKEDKVTVMDNFCSGQMSYIEHYLDDSRFTLIKGDLMDLELVKESTKGHDFIFHFAANPDIAKSMIETDIDIRLGVILTYNVVEAMRINNIKKIAYSGSGVYGDVGHYQTPEDFGPLLPISMYGASKVGAECVISAFCHMFDMQAWIYRFANVVGKKQTHGVCYDFIRKLKKDPSQLEILGDGTQSKSYIYINDVINAMLYVINNSDETINLNNIATENYITVREIAEIVVDEMKLDNTALNYTGGDRGWKGDVPIVRFDLTKIHNLGWKSELDSYNAIRKSVQDLLKEH